MKKIIGTVLTAAVLSSALLSWGGASAQATEGKAPAKTPASAPEVSSEVIPEISSEVSKELPEALEVHTDELPAEAAPQAAAVSDDPSVNGEYASPLVTLRADPYLYKHEGKYYFTGSYPEYDRIELTCADSVNGIAAAVPKTIWTAPNANLKRPDGSIQTYYKYVWAPELHYVMGELVIYFAYSQGSLWDIKCCALRCKGSDPMHDEWEYMGVMKTLPSDTFSFSGMSLEMSLDMTVFHHDALDKWYAIWAQKPGASNLYIAELKTPYELSTESVLLSSPDYAWETVRESVNEGPAVLKHAGKIFVSYSAAATGYEYCMGLLELEAYADPMVKANWTKSPEPVFKTDSSRKIYGPGHNCFVEGDNGETLCILHFRDYRDITGDSLNDFNRHAHAMKVTFDRNGRPQFDFDGDDLYNTPFTDHRG